MWERGTRIGRTEETGEGGEYGVADGAFVVAGYAGGAVAVARDVGDEEAGCWGEEFDYLVSQSVSVVSGEGDGRTYMAPPR